MNILMLAPDYPPRLGGVSEYSHRLATHLNHLGHVVRVVTEPASQDAITGLCDDDMSPIRHEAVRLWWRRPANIRSPASALRALNWLRYQVNYLRAASSLYREIGWAGVDIGGFDCALLTWLSPAAADHVLHLYKHRALSYCVLVHGKEVTALVHRRQQGCLDARDGMLLQTLSSAEKVFCASAFTRNEVLKLGVAAEDVVILHPAISIDLVRAGQQAPRPSGRGPAARRPLLVGLGRLVERKGFDQAILAIRALLDRGVEVDYVILGDGPDRVRLQELVQKQGLSDHITMMGSITESQKREWLSQASLFVLPVRELANRDVEGYGIVFLEAAAFGVPAIAGSSGGAPEAVLHGKTGLVVDPNSVDEIASAIERVLADRAWHECMSDNAREHAARQTWDKVAERFLSETRQLFEVEHAGCQ